VGITFFHAIRRFKGPEIHPLAVSHDDYGNAGILTAARLNLHFFFTIIL